jgi:hypothetical protein
LTRGTPAASADRHPIRVALNGVAIAPSRS